MIKRSFWEKVEVGEVPIISTLVTIPWWVRMSPLLLAWVIDQAIDEIKERRKQPNGNSSR